MSLRLKQERVKRKWTQSFVSQKVGISEVAVLLLENGKRKPSYDVLVKLENLFHMNHRKLFSEVDEEKTDS